MVVWSDSLTAIIPSCHEFQRNLTRLVMRSLTSPVSVDVSSFKSGTPTLSPDVSSAKLNTEGSGLDANAIVSVAPVVEEKQVSGIKTLPFKVKGGRNCWGFGHVVPNKSDEIEAGSPKVKRKTQLLAPFYGGLGCSLSVCKAFCLFIHAHHDLIRYLFQFSWLLVWVRFSRSSCFS